jgi:hypothetical protein
LQAEICKNFLAGCCTLSYFQFDFTFFPKKEHERKASGGNGGLEIGTQHFVSNFPG